MASTLELIGHRICIALYVSKSRLVGKISASMNSSLSAHKRTRLIAVLRLNDLVDMGPLEVV